MKYILLAAFAAGFAPITQPSPEPATVTAAICFKTGERTSGFNKICYYDCLGSEAAITIRSTELCPLSIQN